MVKKDFFSLEEFKNVLPHFRRSSEIMIMRKRCRLDVEKGISNENLEYDKECLIILDNELVRRGLRKSKGVQV